jgi:hypothetical protein
MQKAKIKILYRHVIDAAAESHFDKAVIELSYAEFLIKSQAYNREQKYNSFAEMTAADGRANSLHYKSGFAISHLIERQRNKIPFLKDSLGRHLLFDTWKFEVISSDITDKHAHKVAINYITDVLILLDNIGEYMLLAPVAAQLQNEYENTLLLKLQPGLSICEYAALPAGINELKNANAHQ